MSEILINDIFSSHPKPRGLARRRRVTLTVSLAAHVIFGALVAWVVMHTIIQKVEEPESIQAFYVPAPPAPPAPAAATKAASPQPKSEPAVEPKPAEVPTQAAQVAVEPPPPASSVAVGQASGDVLQGVTGGVTGISGSSLGAPPPNEPVRVGGNIKAPALVKKVPPAYPHGAQQARIQGNVVLEAEVAPTGSVESVKVVKSVGMLDQAAIDAVKQWKYSPLVLNGKPVPFILTVTVTFNLG
jgi:protein TonB